MVICRVIADRLREEEVDGEALLSLTQVFTNSKNIVDPGVHKLKYEYRCPRCSQIQNSYFFKNKFLGVSVNFSLLIITERPDCHPRHQAGSRDQNLQRHHSSQAAGKMKSLSQEIHAVNAFLWEINAISKNGF